MAQRTILDAIAYLTELHGFPPTLREIGAHTGRTPSTIAVHLRALRRLGFAEWNPGRTRTLRLKRRPAQ